MKRPFEAFKYSVRNAAGSDEVEVNIDGDIVDAATQEIMKSWFGDETSTSFKSFRSQVDAANPKTVTVFINSQGGMVTDALAIHDYLVGLTAKGVTVNTVGRGLIASAATFILLAGGDNSRITKNSWFMIHNASGAVYGNVNEIENYARATRKINDQITQNYADRTGMKFADVAAMMDQETWLNGEDAVAQGFVADIAEDAPFTNKIEAGFFNWGNQAILNSYNGSVGKPAAGAGILDTLRSEFKKDFMNLSNDLKKLFKNAKDDKATDKIPNKADILDLVNKVLTPFAAKVDAALKAQAEAAEEKAADDDTEEVVDPKKKKTGADDTEGEEGEEGADGEDGEDADGDEEGEEVKTGDSKEQTNRIKALEAELAASKTLVANLKKTQTKNKLQPSGGKNTGKKDQPKDKSDLSRFLVSQ